MGKEGKYKFRTFLIKTEKKKRKEKKIIALNHLWNFLGL